MSTAAVEKRVEKSALPSLINTPAMQITAEDVALPRLYVGQFMSKAVQDDLVKMGDIYSSTGADDPDPVVLWSLKEKDTPGILFHVTGLRKGKSYSDGGELSLWDYDDPSAPAEAWVTYNYTLVLPEIDEQVPFKLLLTKTGRPTALQINTVLARRATAGPSWTNAFRLTSAERSNAKGKYAVARVQSVEAEKKNVEIAEKLAVVMSSAATEFKSTGETPAI